MILYYCYWKYNDFQDYLFDMMVKDIKNMIDEERPWWEIKKSIEIYQKYVTITNIYQCYFFRLNKNFCFPIF